MTDKLPPPLLALFQPRPPLRYVTPINRAPEDCKKSSIGGIAQFLPEVKKYEEEIPYTPTESWIQRKLRQKVEKKENINKQLTEGLETCMIIASVLGYISVNTDDLLQMNHPTTNKHEATRSRRCLSLD